MTFTELAIKRPSFVIVIFLVLGFLAVFGYTSLSFELLPNIDVPTITISTIYEGADPNTIETDVTRKIEDKCSSLDKVKHITSTSYDGISVIKVDYISGTNIDFALQDAQRQINTVIPDLPKACKTPTLQKVSVSSIPVIVLSMTSDMIPKDFQQLIIDQIQPQLSKVKGLGEIIIVGGETREIQVNLDQKRINSLGLSMGNISDMINASNLDFPAGKLKAEKNQFSVRIPGKFESINEFKNLIIGKSSTGGDIKLKDVSDVVDATLDPQTISHYNGNYCVTLQCQKQSDANTVQVIEDVKKTILKASQDYKNINLKYYIADDQSSFILDTVADVEFDLLLAIILVASVMFVFLHSIRTAAIVMVSIPCSLTSSFVLMWIAGFSLNLMTMLALSLVIGILVDDSIVVIENIYHRLEKGDDKVTAAITGRNEIGFAAVSITFVDIVVFLPLCFLQGLISGIFLQFSLVVLISTLTSLFVSFTVIPILASKFGKLEDTTKDTLMNKFGNLFEKSFDWLVKKYLSLLKWSLANPIIILGIAASLLVFAFSLPVKEYVGFEFVPTTDRSEFMISVEMPPGTSLEQTNRYVQEFERIIDKEFPEVTNILSNVGLDADGQKSDNQAQMVVFLVEKKDRKENTVQYGTRVQEKLLKIAGSQIYINQYGIAGNANSAPVSVQLAGPDRDSVLKALQPVGDAMNKTPGITQLRFSSEAGNPETRVEIDRDRMASFGLTMSDVGKSLVVALTGNTDSDFKLGADQYKIRIQLDKFNRSNPDDLIHLNIVNRQGKSFELQQFAKIYQSIAPSKLERRDRNPNTQISAYTDGSPSGSVSANIFKVLGNNYPKNVKVELAGDHDDEVESFTSLGVALFVGILFVYFIMVLLYDNFIYPFVVLFSIPLATFGALSALWLSGNSISIFSLLGMIMMTGLVAKNAILLVDRTNEKRSEGESVYESLLEAGASRIRPIMMTTLAMVIGMLPIATAQGSGAEWKNGLGWALIGGLSSSMFLTLVVVPVVYTKISSAMDWKKNRAAKKQLKLEAKLLEIEQNNSKDSEENLTDDENNGTDVV